MDEVPSPTSYRDVLTNVFGSDNSDEECWGDFMEEEEALPENRWYKKDNDNHDKHREPFNPGPEIPLSDEELKQWSKPWRNTLIVKVLGKRVNFKLLESRLQRYWVKNGTMKITDLADDFYLVRLSSQEDYRHALFEGPWKVADHYLIIQRWRPLFSMTATLSSKIAVWIRIPKLPSELCNDVFLKRIGSTLGTMLKVDKLTSIHDRGKFARICVELDLVKPFVSHIVIRGMKLFLEYEGIH